MFNLTHTFKHLWYRFATQENGVLLIAVVLALGILWNTLGALQQNFALQQTVDQLRQEVEVTELETDLLAFEQQYYNSEEYLQISAKQHLNKAEPGEKIIVLPTVEPLPEAKTSKPLRAIAPSKFEQWLVFLFGSKSA